MNAGRIIAIVFLLEMALASLVFYGEGFTLTGLQTVTRFSGRLSLLIFSILFLIHHKRGHIDTLLLGKPYHTFAFAHGIHLLELLLYIYLSAAPVVPVRMAGGFIAYLFIFLMPWLTARQEAGNLSPKLYAIIEKIFQYYTWLIFFMTYLPRVRGVMPHVGGTYREHVLLLGWVSLMMGMKITGLLQFRSGTSR